MKPDTCPMYRRPTRIVKLRATVWMCMACGQTIRLLMMMGVCLFAGLIMGYGMGQMRAWANAPAPIDDRDEDWVNIFELDEVEE